MFFHTTIIHGLEAVGIKVILLSMAHYKVTKRDKDWRHLLTPEQYEITRRKGTEPPFTGKYYNFKEKGAYRCICCGNELFTSAMKFDSCTGWPSFRAPFSEENIESETDTSHNSVRTEVKCSQFAEAVIKNM